MMRAQGGLVHSGDDPASARGAYSRRSKRPLVTHPFRRQPIQMRRDGVGIAKTTKMRANIFCGKPKNVRPLRRKPGNRKTTQ